MNGKEKSLIRAQIKHKMTRKLKLDLNTNNMLIISV